MKTRKESVTTIRTRNKRHNENVGKYLPETYGGNDKIVNSDIRIICPKSGQVLETISNDVQGKEVFNKKRDSLGKHFDRATEELEQKHELNEILKEFIK